MCIFLYSIQFQIKYQCKYGYNMFVSGNIESLGGWNLQKALKLDWNTVFYIFSPFFSRKKSF